MALKKVAFFKKCVDLRECLVTTIEFKQDIVGLFEFKSGNNNVIMVFEFLFPIMSECIIISKRKNIFCARSVTNQKKSKDLLNQSPGAVL